MRKSFTLGLMFAAAACATAALAQTSPGRQAPQQQQPPQPQIQIPVQQAPAITQRAPLTGQVPVFIQGHYGDRLRRLERSIPAAQRGPRSIHATRENPDYDRDGYDATQFGGPDCDDEDPRVNPAKLEVTDAEGLNEDCNPETLGDRDDDLDGYISWQSMNILRTNDLRPIAVLRGPDCDDSRADVHPGLPEVLGDLRDNNCDGLIDVVDSRGHGDYCPPTEQVSAQTLTRPCGQASGDTSQFNRR